MIKKASEFRDGEGDSGCYQLNPDSEVNSGCGISVHGLGAEDIRHLQSGGFLMLSDGEYEHLVFYKESPNAGDTAPVVEQLKQENAALKRELAGLREFGDLQTRLTALNHMDLDQ